AAGLRKPGAPPSRKRPPPGPPPPVAARPDQPVTETSPETACRNAGRLPNVNAAGVTQRSQARRRLFACADCTDSLVVCVQIRLLWRSRLAAPPTVTAWPGSGIAGHGCAAAAGGCFAQASRFCSASAAIARASAPAGLGRDRQRCCGRWWDRPLLPGVAVVAEGGPWINRLVDPPARVRVALRWRGGRQRSRVPAVRPCAGWRSSSPLPSGGAGTTGTGAVRGRTRRSTSPAAACGPDQPGRGRRSPWRPCPVWAGGVGVHDLVSDDSGPFRVSLGGLAGLPAWYRKLMSPAGLGIAAGFTVAGGGGVHHA